MKTDYVTWGSLLPPGVWGTQREFGNRGGGGGVCSAQQNPDPVQDTKM